MLKSAGVDAVYCDGDIETNENGIVKNHHEALTTSDGKVLVSSNATLPSEHIAYHENVHVNQKLGTEAYTEYESIICNNLLYKSKAFEDVCAQINENHYDGKYDIEDTEDANKFIREIAAYVNEFVMTEPQLAEQIFGEMFEDWNAVVAAVKQFNTDTKADFSGSASFMDKTGKTDNIKLGGIDTGKARHLNRAEQQRITEIGERLGRKVIYEDFYSLEQFKGKKKIPDGYIDGKGDIHINFFAKRPIQFIFKHEITHYLKRSLSAYQDFMNMVFESEAFKNWLHKKGYASIDELKAEITDTYSEVKGFKEENCYDEILADFCAGYLFGGENAVSQELINALEPKKKRTFLDVIKDVIAYFKEKFSKDTQLKAEIAAIEKAFIDTYNKAVQTTNKQYNDISYSIVSDSNGEFVAIDTNQDIFVGKTAQEMQDIAKKIIRDNFKGKVLSVGKNGKAYINKHSSEEYAYPANRRMGEGIKESKMRAAPELDNLLSVSKFIEHQDDDGRHPQATGGWDVYSTRFKVDEMMFSGEVKIMITERGCIFYDITQIKRLPVNSGQTENNSVAASGNLSIDSIADNNSSVNTNSMQENKNYSIPVLERAERTTENTEFTEQINELNGKLQQGEISQAEFIERVRNTFDETTATKKQKVSNPVEIANMTEEDADTTPPLKRRHGESNGDKTSNTYESLLESDIFDDKFKEEVKADGVIDNGISVYYTYKEGIRHYIK